ncbi:hypothetical protein CBR_g17069 [Chara braunii]|uniref:Uncharacterized protein n=1 Tax=Chara braunii TaxID=69332 RepID=A0A388KUK7_CHABU|nr:hypothetical protein CBR_g17069 [Chara braunii]|eukprot:GBG73729.1 hypothetical protein CBR_g17069 [Chara braunii]
MATMATTAKTTMMVTMATMATTTIMATTAKTTTMAMHEKSKMVKTVTTAKAMATLAKTTKTAATTATTVKTAATTMMATIGGGLWGEECAQKAAACGRLSSTTRRRWRTRHKVGIVADGEPSAATTFVPQGRTSAERRQEQLKARW